MRRRHLAAFHDDRTAEPKTLGDQALVQRRNRQDQRQCRAGLTDPTVRNNDQAAVLAHPPGHRIAEAGQRALQRLAVDLRAVVVEHLETGNRCLCLRLQLGQLARGQHRGRDHDLRCRSGREHRPGAQSHPQGHAIGLTDRIKRRVGHLRKPLAEILRHPAFFVRQRVDGVPIAHGRDLLGAALQHGVHEQLQALLIEAVGDKALVGVQAVIQRRLSRRRHWQVVEIDPRSLQQRAVVLAAGEVFERLHGVEGTTAVVVVVERAAGLDPAARDYLGRRKVDLPGFGHGAEILVGLDRAERAQTQTVEPRANDLTIAENHRRRAVVLFLVEREVFEHVAHVLRDRRIVLPRRRHHRDHGLDHVQLVFVDAAGQGLVKTRRVRLTDRRVDAPVLGTGDGIFGQAVLLVRVQLAVVGHLPERLGHGGLAVGVGGKPGVEEQRAGLVVAVLQVEEVRDNLPRVQLPLEHLGL